MPRRKKKVAVEICVEDLASARAAELGGADRIELCADLLEGGTTPSMGTLEVARKSLRIPAHVMIRPRGGDFRYDDDELAAMLRDIRAVQQAKLAGIVFGILDGQGNVDRDRCRVFVEFAKPLTVTFHRAFDLVADPVKALDELIEIGFDRVLSSGQAATAWDGRQVLQELVNHAAGRIEVMAGAGVNVEGATDLVKSTGVQAVHAGTGVCQELAEPAPEEGGDAPSLDLGRGAGHKVRHTVNAEQVRALVEACRAVRG